MTSATTHPDGDFEGVLASARDWPILLVEFPRRRVSDAALRALLAHVETLLSHAAKSRDKLFVIVDISAMRELASASQRKYAGEWNRRLDSLATLTTVGGATVTPSSILRGIITAVFWIHPPKRTMYVVATQEEAVLKGIEVLGSAGVALPAQLVARGSGAPG
jgi:hypothetical protein